MNNHAIVKMKNPEQAIELNGLLKSKYKIMAEAFNTSGILEVGLHNVNDSIKPVILAIIKFSRTKNFNRYINIVKSENFEQLLKNK